MALIIEIWRRWFLALVCVLGPVGAYAAEPVYFLLEEKTPFHHDSCLIRLFRDEDILEARRQIKELPLEQRPDISANVIAIGADFVNANYATGVKFWSWISPVFIGFGQFEATVQSYPSDIEEQGRWFFYNYETRTSVTNREVFFGGYALSAEISAQTMGTNAYFLVGSEVPDLNDSYFLEITRPEQIFVARRLLSEPVAERKIVVALIEKGADALNRDYLAPGSPAWSWHIAQFVGFSDGAAEVTDGTPTYVEKNLDQWIQITRGSSTPPNQGFIGFQSYHVLREFSSPPLVTWVEPHPTGTALRWANLGSNYVYTVEASTNILTPSWSQVPGANWPIAQTNFLYSSTPGSSVYFRVRADQTSTEN